MRTAHLSDMVKGWFIGDFEPSIMRTRLFEVAVKRYRRGEAENSHHHKLASEITLVVSGKVIMRGQKWGPGAILLLEAGESTSFRALRNSVIVVVKTPSHKGDKYFD